MTPVREFVYFLILLLIFSFILLLWKEEVPAPVSVAEFNEPVVDTLVQAEPAADSLQTMQTPEDEPATEPKVERELFQPSPFVFAESDSVHLQFLTDRLQNANASKLPVRIVYFGDSQIENDRITSVLRKQLQAQYAGRGPGFVPLDEYYNTHHRLLIEPSGNWEIKTFQDKDFVNESLLFKNALLTAANPEGWFRIRRIKRLGPKPDYELMKLYYTARDSCRLTVRQGKDVIYTGFLLPHERVSTLDFQFNRTPDDIRFDFTVRDTLNIAGLSLESGGGVLVDNVALRGLSYPTFDASNQEMIHQMLNQVNVGLFVLHFGVNLVPYISNNYRHFERNFQRQISYLKSIRPEVPILIIGVSDMAKKLDGTYASYPNIPQIKAIQYELAMKNHTAFWDLQNFMGGEGAMVQWVNRSPALGRTDYVHFSAEGAAVVGKELARLLLEELKTDRNLVTR
ncbi:hypothetical protein [uncultured Sunxiuqinia sp.]|uniref:hypothetical protein n=1 Tax=uncultured Sunxiuqinia sp. TaxID=1573825 RepID=UPI00260A5227|nr:hypothetical protein [uncultured Sunxiuqinia sp.]